MSIFKGMEKHICDEMRFYMFSRIDTGYEYQKKFYYKECGLETLMSMQSKSMPAWIQEKMKTSAIYQNLLVLDIENPMGETLALEYLSRFSLKSKQSVAELFLQGSLCQYILYDFKLNSFMYALELSLACPTSWDSEGFMVRRESGSSIDLYNCIRDMIVDTGENTHRSFLEESRKLAYERVNEVLVRCYDLPETELVTKQNAGNITVVTTHAQDSTLVEECILATNRLAERLEYTEKPIPLNQCICSFNGRFHSIITNHRERQYHYIPVTFQAQLVWSYLNTLNEVIENMNMELQGNNHLSLSIEHKRLISSLVEKIQILHYQNEMFKSSIENESEPVYGTFEKTWQLSSTMSAKKEFILYLNDYLSQVQAEESEQSAKRQNQILFSISMLQILALISIWTDFLSLLEEYGGYAESVVKGNQTISLINLGMPFFLILLSLYLLLIGMKRKK